jgi:serine/threonine protein kinase
LATGSWSSVYAAERDPALGERATGAPQAALKFVPTGTLTSRQLSHLADMTDRELTVHRRLSHPSLIKVLDTHVIDDPTQPRLDGATVLALELAERSAAAALATVEGGLPEAPRLIAEICAGLAHLHEAGWVHGDLKPSNVLLMADGSVRLADFGLAAEMNGTHAYLPPGGTADYMPPERWAESVRAGGTAIRQTADIWALGVTACQLLTGRLPFSGVTSRARMSAAAAFAEGRGELALPESLTPQWRQFIVDCMAPDHAARLRHTATSLLPRARAAADGVPLTMSVRQPDAAKERGRAVGRSRRLFIGLAGAFLATAGGSLAVLRPWADSGADDPSPVSNATNRYERYFRTDADIPPQYYDLIVQAGTKCPDQPAVKPHLVAAILKAESNFNPDLKDPANDEYGIARWTPRVLQYYLPGEQSSTEPKPPFPPEVSIPHLGSFLCRFAPELRGLAGDAMVNLAAAWRTSADRVREANGVPDRPALKEYIPRLQANIAAYRPKDRPTATPS